jgi:anti-sigma regulatory factor (Ser/Thr protein kinase)
MADTAANHRVLKARPSCATAFQATENAVPAARAYVTAALEAWGLTPLMDDAKLLVSELITNAVRYSADTVVVRCSVSEDAQFVIEVGDSSPELPKIGTAEPLDVHGRGLVIVEAVAADWGAYRVDGGKVTWAALDLEKTN